jgi:hypothetical protein
VYKTSSGANEDSEDSANKEPLPVKLPPDGETDLVVENTKPHQRTDRQREIAGIRQLERRKSKRRKKRSMKEL